MGRTGQPLAERWSGLKLVKVSGALGLAGVLPLALYVLLGPADGNPIGLGLLAVVTVPFASMGMAVGSVKMLVERLGRRGD